MWSQQDGAFCHTVSGMGYLSYEYFELQTISASLKFDWDKIDFPVWEN